MAFNIKNFSFAGGAQLGPDTKIPKIFTYYSGDDTIEDIIAAQIYFGLGPGNPGYNEQASITNIISFGSIIVITANVASGTPAQHSTILLIESEKGQNVAYQPMPEWIP